MFFCDSFGIRCPAQMLYLLQGERKAIENAGADFAKKASDFSETFPLSSDSCVILDLRSKEADLFSFHSSFFSPAQ